MAENKRVADRTLGYCRHHGVQARGVNQNVIAGFAANAEHSRRFVEALLAPPRKSTQRIRAAMRAYKQSVKSDLD